MATRALVARKETQLLHGDEHIRTDRCGAWKRDLPLASNVRGGSRFANRDATAISSTSPGLLQSASQAIWATTFQKGTLGTIVKQAGLEGRPR